jgi:hypothetical protein
MELTKTQTKIISDIEKEFIRINEEKKTIKGGDLLKLNTLLLQRSEDMEKRNEILISNKAKERLYYELLENSAIRLDEEFMELNFRAWTIGNKIFIDSESIYNAHMGGTCKDVSRNCIRIGLSQSSEWTTFASKIDGISKITNIDGFYLADESHARNYPTLEGLTSSSTFVDKVQRIVNFINFSHE